MKEIELTDGTDITLNSLLIFSVLQLSVVLTRSVRRGIGLDCHWVVGFFFQQKAAIDTQGRRCTRLKLSFSTVSVWLQCRNIADEV